MNIIHRGIANKKLKENCFKSFKESFNKKYGIETDIHFTKDNKIICFHDFTLNRLFKINKSVKNLHYDEIKNKTKSKISVPLLKDVLKLLIKEALLQERNYQQGGKNNGFIKSEGSITSH